MNSPTKKKTRTMPRLGQIDFLILELGPDQKDSSRFKKAMEERKLGRDLTPKLTGLKRKTQKRDVTYLSELVESDFATPQFKRWLQSFAKCKPVILYISGHHALSRPIFYNNNDCGIRFEKDKLNVGKYLGIAFMPVYTNEKPQTIEAKISGLTDRLFVIIGDACSLTSSGVADTPGAGLRLQEILSGKNGNPLILGFVGKSPLAGTETLHTIFVRCLASKLKVGPVTDEDLINCWRTAGQLWSNSKYKKNLGALDTRGKLRDYRGKPLP